MKDYADSITAERVKRVIDGYGEGKKAVAGTGGNFSYYELGEPLMNGNVLNENVGVDKIREYIYFTDTKSQMPEAHPDEPYFMGVHVNNDYYFYYEKQAVTTLNREFLHTVKTRADAYVIYADLCTLSDTELEKYHITFKKIPRDITKLQGGHVVELNNYQNQVMHDLSGNMACVNNSTNLFSAWREYWFAKDVAVGLGGVPSYNNAIERVPHVCMKVPTGGYGLRLGKAHF